MSSNNELLEALNILEREKNISKETLLEAIENSLVTACKNHFGTSENVKVSANRADKNYISTLFKEIMIAKFFLMVICIIVYTISFVWTSSDNKILCAIMIMNIIDRKSVV